MSYAFTKIYECIKKAVKAHNTETQISVSLTHTDKIIWMHMLSKYLSFKNSGSLYFETQEQIAEATGTSIRATKYSLRKLKHLGIFQSKKVHVEKHIFCTVYQNIYDPNDLHHLILYDIYDKQIDKSSFKITLTDPFLGK